MVEQSANESSCYLIFAGARITPVSRVDYTSRNTENLLFLRDTSAGETLKSARLGGRLRLHRNRSRDWCQYFATSRSLR